MTLCVNSATTRRGVPLAVKENTQTERGNKREELRGDTSPPETLDGCGKRKAVLWGHRKRGSTNAEQKRKKN